jgi:Glutamate decarboxylase and related PLP-dependent proteins
LSDAIESNLACARHLESMVRASDDFEMVAPVELSIFCFRHVPAQLRIEPPEAIDAFNERCWSLCNGTAVRISRMPRSAVASPARLCVELSDDFARHGDPARRFATRGKIATASV